MRDHDESDDDVDLFDLGPEQSEDNDSSSSTEEDDGELENTYDKYVALDVLKNLLLVYQANE